jgi:hypothetical protein
MACSPTQPARLLLCLVRLRQLPTSFARPRSPSPHLLQHRHILAPRPPEPDGQPQRAMHVIAGAPFFSPLSSSSPWLHGEWGALSFPPYRPLLRDSMVSEVAASGAEQSPSRGAEVKAHAMTCTGIEVIAAPYGLSSSSHHESRSRGWISACRSDFLKSLMCSSC